MDNWSLIKPYIPKISYSLVKPIIEDFKGFIIPSKPRKSKLGDFRVKKNGEICISINDDLNPDAFLVTLLHEIAHYHVYRLDSKIAKAHGKQWKRRFQYLISQFLDKNIFSINVQFALKNQLTSPKASCGSSIELMKALNPELERRNTIEKLPLGCHFELKNGKKFKLGVKRKTRYECFELSSNLIFTIHPLAEAKLI
tara:strand:+ start:5241 stop:5834 length:594 start_codon:yes stop_codon:yes gene_type:complete